jgi:anti-sigma regulatory factor (Ser/Thr protein kinase)
MSADAPSRPTSERPAMTVRELDPLELRFPAAIDAVPRARHRFSHWLTAARVDRPIRDELALVITELVTNAVEASPGPNAVVEVVATLEDGPEVVLSVSDAGAGFQMVTMPNLPPHATIRGRGLPIVNALMDHIGIEREHGRTQVTASRAIRP